MGRGISEQLVRINRTIEAEVGGNELLAQSISCGVIGDLDTAAVTRHGDPMRYEYSNPQLTVDSQYGEDTCYNARRDRVCPEENTKGVDATETIIFSILYNCTPPLSQLMIASRQLSELLERSN
jgi:hypothetical protein